MATAYEILGIGPDATREELEAAYAARREQYAAERHVGLPEDLQRIAAQRRAQIAAAYHDLRAALAAPPRLAPAAERRRDRETIVAVLVLLLLALPVPFVRDIAAPPRTVAVTGAESALLSSEVAPDFMAQTLDGETVRLSDFKGKVVLINFWATWCPPCVRETPRLVRVAEMYRDQGLVVLGVNTTYQDDPARVRQFVSEQKIGYPVLLDADGAIGAKYPARLMPTTYLLDREGKIVHTKVGEVDEATLMEQVRSVLEQ